ncbi:MAG: patatin-like phospholipase family protein [Anaerolineales bacterium]
MDISLALGGGGVRGAAHIGVLRALENSGFRVRAVAGSSIGSIIGAFYALGHSPAEIEQKFAALDQSKLFGWPLSDGAGLLGMRGLLDFLRANFGNKTFDQLNLPCAAVAVDLKSNREIILREGGILDAVLGSSAIPGLFPPREIAPYVLIDGGVLDPVPVRAARSLAPGLPVVAVSLMPPLESPAIPLTFPVPRPLAERLTRLHFTQAIQVFADAIDIGQREMTELRLSLDRPEVLIRPALAEINVLDLINVAEVARLGEVATLQALPALKRLDSWPRRLRGWWRELRSGDSFFTVQP